MEVYKKLLDAVILKSEDGIPHMPEMYSVPKDKVTHKQTISHTPCLHLQGVFIQFDQNACNIDWVLNENQVLALSNSP